MNRRRAGFTLVEVLAALLFLGIAMPAILGALSVTARSAELAERTTTAGHLAENLLNQMMIEESSGVTTTVEPRGEFGKEYPGFRWETRQESWTVNSSMTEVTVEVFFPVQGRERSVVLSTVFTEGAAST